MSLLRGPKDKQLVALLLVGTLLLCHGVFGVLHLCSTTPTAPTHQTHEHPSVTDETAAGHEHPACHLTGGEYFVVLFTAFLGLVLGLLKGTRLWGRVASFRPSKPYLPPLVSHPPRGPTNLPVLQVFRL